jgi:hypothetical protein
LVYDDFLKEKNIDYKKNLEKIKNLPSMTSINQKINDFDIDFISDNINNLKVEEINNIQSKKNIFGKTNPINIDSADSKNSSEIANLIIEEYKSNHSLFISKEKKNILDTITIYKNKTI